MKVSILTAVLIFCCVTSFAEQAKKKAIETVTASFEDNKWKVVGYFIK